LPKSSTAFNRVQSKRLGIAEASPHPCFKCRDLQILLTTRSNNADGRREKEAVRAKEHTPPGLRIETTPEGIVDKHDAKQQYCHRQEMKRWH